MSEYTASLNHAFNVEHAKKYGVDCAIVLGHIAFWINFNKQNNKNFHDGKYWMYQTREGIAAHLPYYSSDQIKRILNRLVDHGVLIKGNYNKMKMDKTNWYAFNESLRLGDSAQSMEQIAHRVDDSAQAIPDTKTDTETCTYTKGPSKLSDTPKIQRCENVHLTEAEHQKLLDEFGEAVTFQAYEELSLWKADAPKSKWGKSDYRSIKKWAYEPAIKKVRMKNLPDPKKSKGAFAPSPRVDTDNLDEHDKQTLEAIKNKTIQVS